MTTSPMTAGEPHGARKVKRAIAARYEFLVAGSVSESVAAAFPELAVTTSATGGTALYGPVQDAAHLRGLLDRFEVLGLTVLELRQLPD